MILLFGPLVPKVDKPDFSEEQKKAEEAARRARAEAAQRAGRSASIITGEADLSKLGGRGSILGGGR